MQSELNLKPCPFCGSTDVELDVGNFVQCNGCFLMTHGPERWNRRAGSDAVPPGEVVAWKDVRNELAVAMVGLLLNQQANTATGADFERLLDRLADEGRGAIHKLKHSAPAPAQSAGSDAVPERQAALAEVRAEVREMQDNLETFGEYGQETARVALDGVLDRIDELAAAPQPPAPESSKPDNESWTDWPDGSGWMDYYWTKADENAAPELVRISNAKAGHALEGWKCPGIDRYFFDFKSSRRFKGLSSPEQQPAPVDEAAELPEPDVLQELAKQQLKLPSDFQQVLHENRDDLYIAQADQPERGELPELLEELFALIEGAPELNMSNYNDDDVSELNASIIEIYQVAQKVKAALSATKPAPVDDGLFNLATDAWSRSTDAAWDSDGLTAVIRALTTPAPVDWEAERERFHLWVKSKGGSVIRRDGSYIESMTQLWWVCWKARAALATAGGDEKPVGYASAYMLNLFAKGEADFVSVFRSQPESMKPVALYTRPDSSRLAEAVREYLKSWDKPGLRGWETLQAREELRQALAQYETKGGV